MFSWKMAAVIPACCKASMSYPVDNLNRKIIIPLNTATVENILNPLVYHLYTYTTFHKMRIKKKIKEIYFVIFGIYAKSL
jgi:hypothetical protein